MSDPEKSSDKKLLLEQNIGNYVNIRILQGSEFVGKVVGIEKGESLGGEDDRVIILFPDKVGEFDDGTIGVLISQIALIEPQPSSEVTFADYLNSSGSPLAEDDTPVEDSGSSESIVNPYTGERQEDISPENSETHHPIRFCGLLWKKDDYDAVMKEINEGTLDYDTFYALAKEYCKVSFKELPKYDVLRELFTRYKNPQEAVNRALISITFQIDALGMNRVVASLEENNNPNLEDWMRLLNKINGGITTMYEYVDALVETFPQLLEVERWQDAKKMLHEVRHFLFFTALMKNSDPSPLDTGERLTEIEELIEQLVVEKAQENI